jgi:hypothetical protein
MGDMLKNIKVYQPVLCVIKDCRRKIDWMCDLAFGDSASDFGGAVGHGHKIPKIPMCTKHRDLLLVPALNAIEFKSNWVFSGTAAGVRVIASALPYEKRKL